MSYDWWLAPAAITAVHIVLLEGRIRRAERKGNGFVFGGSILLKALYGGAALALAILLILQWRQTAPWLNISASILIVLFLLGWPKTIITNNQRIECLWWWKKRVAIPWSEVELAQAGKAGTIEVIGANARIRFEGYHPDPERFVRELKDRAKIKSIQNPDQFSGLHL